MGDRIGDRVAVNRVTQVHADIDERSPLMCHPAWGRAFTAAQRQSDLARLRRVRDVDEVTWRAEATLRAQLDHVITSGREQGFTRNNVLVSGRLAMQAGRDECRRARSLRG